MFTGRDHEIHAGILAADNTRMTYFMCFVRHIEGIRYHLYDPLAPRYIDVVDVNHTLTIDRARHQRLSHVKVGRNCDHAKEVPSSVLGGQKIMSKK